jgi:hypothetical protein
MITINKQSLDETVVTNGKADTVGSNLVSDIPEVSKDALGDETTSYIEKTIQSSAGILAKLESTQADFRRVILLLLQARFINAAMNPETTVDELDRLSRILHRFQDHGLKQQQLELKRQTEANRFRRIQHDGNGLAPSGSRPEASTTESEVRGASPDQEPGPSTGHPSTPVFRSETRAMRRARMVEARNAALARIAVRPNSPASGQLPNP